MRITWEGGRGVWDFYRQHEAFFKVQFDVVDALKSILLELKEKQNVVWHPSKLFVFPPSFILLSETAGFVLKC